MKSNKKQSKANNNCNKKNANISNKLDSNIKNKKSNNVNGFTNESKSFQLDDNDEHSFEIR